MIDIERLKEYDSLYIIGHENVDADSYFSSYLLSKVLKSFGINAIFTVLDDYVILDEDVKLVDDYLKEKPFVLEREKIEGKNFILVDHNDIDQSLKNDKCKIVLAIDHHIDSGKVKHYYSVEYTSTALYIYELFKDIYKFDKEEKELIAISVMTDSCYLTTSRFKESDEKIYKELNVKLDVKEMRYKYFKTTDFSLDVDYNIKNNFKFYNINNRSFNRVMIKAYEKDRDKIEIYLKRVNELYNHSLLIWDEFDTLITRVYYKGKLIKEYKEIVTSTILILKELLKEGKI